MASEASFLVAKPRVPVAKCDPAPGFFEPCSVDPQLFEESTLHDVSSRPLQNCDWPGVVSVPEVDCDGRVFVVFHGGTMAIHPLS